jgi:hypothetical protein
MVLKNNTASTINFIKICVGGTVGGVEKDCTTDGNYYGSVAPGATFTRTIIDLNYATACTSGVTYSIVKSNIIIDYNNSDISALKEQGAGDLIGTCT